MTSTAHVSEFPLFKVVDLVTDLEFYGDGNSVQVMGFESCRR